MIVNLSSRVISDIKKKRSKFWDNRGRVEIYMSEYMFCVVFWTASCGLIK